MVGYHNAFDPVMHRKKGILGRLYTFQYDRHLCDRSEPGDVGP